MLTQPEEEYFAQEQTLHQAKYLTGTTPQEQSGFGRDASDWERFRRLVVAPIDKDGSELVYVPPSRRRPYAERRLERFVAPEGRLLICSYGTSRPEGNRADTLVDELGGWG